MKSFEFSTREYNKKSGHDSFFDLSKSILNDTVLSNSVVINAISNFLDIKAEDKSKHKNHKDLYHSQVKVSSKNIKMQKSNKSSKSLIKNNNNNNKNKNSNFNISNLSKNSMAKNTNHNNLLSMEFSPSTISIHKSKNKNRAVKKKSLDNRSTKEVVQKLSNKENNNAHNKFEIGKISNPKRSGTISGMKNKLKETFIGRKKTVDIYPVKKKRPFKLMGEKLLNNNVKRKSCFNNFGHISNNNLMSLTKEEEIATSSELMAILAFREIHKKLKNNIGENIRDKLYNYENNDITDAINRLPSLEKEKTNKSDSKNVESNNSNIKNKSDTRKYSEKIFDKNDKEQYRFLNLKGNVYDSLDDEEVIEEIFDSLLLTPESDFLIFFDTIIMISSFIILTYLPLYLAKNISFCHTTMEFNEIIFFIIDFIYIIDFILGFFRAYYNFDEILVKNSIKILNNYLNSWFFFDLITSIPIFTLMKFFQTKCTFENDYLHSFLYNKNLNNLYHLLVLLKVIKTFKVFNSNLSLDKIANALNENEFIYDWGNVFLFLFFFIASINFSACLYVFIGRNTYPSWIVNFNLDNSNFNHIYIASIYYIIMTITTVGYGDLVGRTLTEFIFQTIILIAGTCIYSWLISSTSSYIKKMSDMNIHYENRKKILDEIKLSNPSFSKDLYEKIMRLLNYRKYYEETDNHIILESLPYSLRNSLIMEMYKPFINNFKFFKNIKNRDFIVQVVSKLKPVLAVKGDILVQEGDFIEDIMFVKEGILSLEIQIDLDYPDKCIEQYLNKNKILTVVEQKSKISRFNQQTKNFLRDNEITSKKLYKSKFLEVAGTNINHKNKLLDMLNKANSNFSSSEDNDNISFIKILRIRKNEHFGDVFMFLNNRSPLYVRVGSKKVELLLLKKLDAVSISTTYPGLWKKVIAKSLINTKKIKNLTLKMLIIFCNFHGIKTNFFKQQKYCLNDIKCMLPNSTTITNDFKFSKKKMLPLNNEIENSLIELSRQSDLGRESDDDEDKTEGSNESEDNDDEEETENKKNEITDVIYEEQDEGSLSETSVNHLSPVSKKSKSKKGNSRCKSTIDFNNMKSMTSMNKKENLNKRETANISEKKRKVNFSLNNTQIKSKDKSHNNIKNLSNKTTIEKVGNHFSSSNIAHIFNNNCNKNDSINENLNNSRDILNKNDSAIVELNSNKFYTNSNNNKYDLKSINSIYKYGFDQINDELYPGEILNHSINNSIINLKSPKSDIKRFHNEKIYIKNLNIIENNYLGQIFDKKENTIEKSNKSKSEEKKNSFDSLEISLESTMEINSSYENINKITNYQYISDNNLRKKTKMFLLDECNAQIIKNVKKPSEKCASSICNKGNNMSSSLLTSEINNKSNIYDHSKTIEKYTKKSIKRTSMATTKHKFNMSTINKKNTFFNKLRNSLGDNDPDKKLQKENLGKNLTISKDNAKKKKKENEMVMISHNMKQNFENLKNPELFYTGLFTNIIEKQKKTYKPTSKQKNKRKSKGKK